MSQEARPTPHRVSFEAIYENSAPVPRGQLPAHVPGVSDAQEADAILGLALAGQVMLLGAVPAVPTPESVFGFKPGADYKLATYDQSIAYLKKLAAASKYVKLVEAGRTTQGRTMYFALDLASRRTWRSSIATARSRSGWRTRRA